MCGRFALYTPCSKIARDFFAIDAPVEEVKPSYNITPGREINLMTKPVANSPVTMWFSRWGFRPASVRNEKAPAPINARAESVAHSRYFGYDFAHHRGLVPADGFYEWRVTERGKQPWYISRRDGGLLFFAAIWAPAGEGAGSCCALVTEPAAVVLKELHDRMPVMLDPSCHQHWLDPSRHDKNAIRAVTQRLDPGKLQAWPVSNRVNRPDSDDPDLIEPFRSRSNVHEPLSGS